jgi:hypothetical protein
MLAELSARTCTGVVRYKAETNRWKLNTGVFDET